MSKSKHRGVIVFGPDGQTVGPTRDREAWKAVRGPLLGSSDTAAILGKDEYTGPWEVWDRIVLGDWDDGEGADIRRGNRQEANARACFIERTGLEVEEVPMLALASDPRIVTDLDGLVVRPETWPDALSSELWQHVAENIGGHGWLELKVPRFARFYQYKEAGLPVHHILQGQHHGMVTGLGWGCFAFYTPEFDDLIAFPVITDRDLVRWLPRALGEWYDRHVTGQQRPERCAPSPPRWPSSVPGEADLREDDAWLEWAELLSLRHYELEEAQQAYVETEIELLKLLGKDDRHVAGGGVTVKRKSTASQRRTDAKAIRARIKLLQKNGDAEGLLTLDPDGDEFKFQTQTSEKIEVKVFGPSPAELMRGVA